MREFDRPHTIVIADDHPLVLRGLELYLAAESSLKIVAACSNGFAALRSIRKLQPDLAVLDIKMPGLSGLEILAAIVHEHLPTKVVLLTAAISEDEIRFANRLGACGVVLKEAASGTLIQCVHSVLSGRRWQPKQGSKGTLSRQRAAVPGGNEITVSLTRREQQISDLAGRGLPNRAIGSQLGISETTVKCHLYLIYEKLRVANRTALAALASEAIPDREPR